MNNKSKFIKVRVSPLEYAAIVKRADVEGLNQSAYVRQQLLQVHEQLDVIEALQAIRDQMRRKEKQPTDPQLELATEAVLLLRELIASRDPQILTKVRAQINQQFQKGGQS